MPDIAFATLGEIIERNALIRPDATAMIASKVATSYDAYFGRVRQLVSAFCELGARRQDRIAVMAPNGTEFCEAYGAGEYAGFITVTVNFRSSAAEVAHVLNDSAALILVFHEQYREVVDRAKPWVTTVRHFIVIGGAAFAGADLGYENMLKAASGHNRVGRARPEDIAYLIYTSGTTGRPKGCILGQSEVCHRVRMMANLIEARASDSILLSMPIFHIGSKLFQMVIGYAGGRAEILTKFEPKTYVAALREKEISIAHMAPSMLGELLEQAPHHADIKHLRLVIYSAAPMPVDVLKRGIERLGRIFFQGYGQTEGGGTFLGTAQHRPDGDEADRRRLASVGTPYPGAEMRIVDDDGQDVPTGSPGEILFRAPFNMRGYWNQSAATLAALREGWLHTGDIGRVDEHGFLYLLDRKKDMIISGGENIYCSEVEAALATHPAVQDVAVFGLKDQRWGETVAAAVCLKAGFAPSPHELIEHCKQQIASYKKPSHIFFMQELPRVNTGKVDKKNLRESYSPTAATS